MEKEEFLLAMAKAILRKAGNKCYVTIGKDRYGKDMTTAGKTFKYDNMNIYGTGNRYYIKNKKEIVLDNKEQIYQPGSWERLLRELYKSRNILEIEKREKDREIRKGKDFYDNYFKTYKDISNKTTCNELLAEKGIEIFIREEMIDYSKEHNFYEYYQIYKDEICVFDASQINNYMKINTFIDGLWLKEFTRALEIIDIIREEEKQEEDNIQNSIIKLKQKRKED